MVSLLYCLRKTVRLAYWDEPSRGDTPEPSRGDTPN